MTTHSAAPDLRRNRSRSEAGSAYLATLLVLVVLTILGLSLAVITQTEVLIGGSEKQATRQLFAADTGVQLAAAFELVTRGSSRHELTLRERTENLLGQDTVIGDTICTTPFLEIHVGKCDLCAINSEYQAVQYAVTINALRHGDAVLGARKTVGAVVSVEPLLQSIDSAGQYSGDASLRIPDDPTIDIDPTTEVDPCEGLYLKI